MSQSFAAKRAFWKQQIADWEQSGESSKQWAARHHHKCQTFIYWKKRFHSGLQAEDFVEIPDPNQKGDSLHLNYKGVHIDIDAHFNPQILAQVLAAIKSALC